MTVPDRSRQGERFRATRIARMNEEFAGKKFDVVREVHLPEGQVFVTRFGQKGRHGYVIRDRETGEQQVVGWKMLRRIHDLYLGVTLPPQRRRGVKKNGREE